MGMEMRRIVENFEQNPKRISLRKSEETSKDKSDLDNTIEIFRTTNDNNFRIVMIKNILNNPDVDRKDKKYQDFLEESEEFLLSSLQDNIHFVLMDNDSPNAEAINHQENIEFALQVLSEIGSRKSIDYILGLVKQDGDAIFMFQTMPLLEKDSEYSAEKIFSLLDANKFNEWQYPRLIIMIADLIGAERLREKLNRLIFQNEQNENEEKAGIFRHIQSFITPDEDKETITNLQRFYNDQINFGDYKLNREMNEKEIELLKILIGKGGKVLEMGCGTGRLLLEMKKAGYDVTGLDFTPRHVEQIKEQDPEAKVFQGDWHQTGIKDESIDAVYSLGRNILHDYSIVDQVRTFREASRVLEKGGKFIFDIPNREKGGYKQMVDEYASEMKKRGIKNFRFGSIYDSPDGEHFATRYAYSEEDIKELANLTGFRIVKKEVRGLETGKGDENIYYVLEKTD